MECKQSLTAQFDEMIRCMKLLSEPAEEQFLQFVEIVTEKNRERSELEAEIRRLQEQATAAQKTVRNLELKLKNARHMLDLEKGRRIGAENDKCDLAIQIQQAVEMLGQGHVVKTQERLQQLQHSFTSQEHYGTLHATNRQHSPIGPLSTITEDHDSVDTILNVSQMDITDEDELEESRLRSGRSYKRRSSPDRQDRSSGSNKRHSGRNTVGDEGKENKYSSEMKTEVTCYTEGDEVKRVKVDIQPSAPPSYLGVTAEELSSWCVKGSRTPGPPPPTPAVHSHLPFTSPPINYNYINLGTPVTPQPYSTPTRPPHTPSLRTHPSASKVNARTHGFVLKTAYKIEHCQPCGKRIKFAKTCLKCPDCRAICHIECREQVPLPCVPAANTPNSNKGHMGTIADYTPSSSPMVPALVVHCTNEVENRGLNEVGIYRQCGAEKDIRELKEQFLRGRGLPNLSQVDVHVITGTLKFFLRSLKEPLITTLLWKDFTTAAEKTEPQDCAASLYQAISELPQPNRETLAWIILHLQRVAECPECKMPAMNLAKVFGPTLVGYSSPEPEPTTMVQETRLQHQVMEKLLEMSSDYWNSIIEVCDENIHANTQQGGGRGSVEHGGTMLGGLPRSGSRRRSQLFRTPLRHRDNNTLNHVRK